MKKYIHILDNRNGKSDLEIDEFGNGKWYVWNEYTDKCIALYTKAEAKYVRANYTEFDLV